MDRLQIGKAYWITDEDCVFEVVGETSIKYLIRTLIEDGVSCTVWGTVDKEGLVLDNVKEVDLTEFILDDVKKNLKEVDSAEFK